jgi:hypothetical protein
VGKIEGWFFVSLFILIFFFKLVKFKYRIREGQKDFEDILLNLNIKLKKKIQYYILIVNIHLSFSTKALL